MKKATTKRERKYGKKETNEIVEIEKKARVKKKKEMFKILVDKSNFIGPFTREKCIEYITNKKQQAEKEHRRPPHMTLEKA